MLHRVRELSQGEVPAFRDTHGFVQNEEGRPPFIRLLPLMEIIAETLGRGPATKGVQQEYQRIVQELGSELRVLVETDGSDLERVAGERLAQGILKARMGDVRVEPGYDGLFGTVRLWGDEQ